MKSYLQSRTFWVNIGFLAAAIFNAYAKNAGLEYELTGDQIMTALAIAGPLANKLLRFRTDTAIVLATPKTLAGQQSSAGTVPVSSALQNPEVLSETTAGPSVPPKSQ